MGYVRARTRKIYVRLESKSFRTRYIESKYVLYQSQLLSSTFICYYQSELLIEVNIKRSER